MPGTARCAPHPTSPKARILTCLFSHALAEHLPCCCSAVCGPAVGHQRVIFFHGIQLPGTVRPDSKQSHHVSCSVETQSANVQKTSSLGSDGFADCEWCPTGSAWLISGCLLTAAQGWHPCEVEHVLVGLHGLSELRHDWLSSTDSGQKDLLKSGSPVSVQLV